MTVALLARARALGLTITADGADLVIRPASKLTPELRANLRTAKPALMALLQAEGALAQDPVTERPDVPEASITRPRPAAQPPPITDPPPEAVTDLNAFDPLAVATRLSQQLDGQNAASAAWAREAAGHSASTHTTDRSATDAPPEDVGAGSLPPPALSLDVQVERAAIQTEPTLPASTTPERERLDAAQRRIVAGLLDAGLKRSPSWSDASAIPSIGSWCSCCRGRRWWRERDNARGWRCATCHPPVLGAHVIEVQP